MFDKMPCVYWNNKTKIEYLQRRIIVHSIIYYELDKNVINDNVYDMLAKQLFKLQNKSTMNELKKTKYYYVFKDFNGATGFDLYKKLNNNDKDYLMMIALNVLKLYEKERGA